MLSDGTTPVDFLLCLSYIIKLKMNLFRPFYPQFRLFRRAGPDSTRWIYILFPGAISKYNNLKKDGYNFIKVKNCCWRSNCRWEKAIDSRPFFFISWNIFDFWGPKTHDVNTTTLCNRRKECCKQQVNSDLYLNDNI